MSSFIVGDELINKVVAGLYHLVMFGNGAHTPRYYNKNTATPQTEEEKRELAQKLYEMNVKAVNQRYGTNEKADDFTYKTEYPPEPVQLYKFIQCLHYQCSEGDVPEKQLYKDLEDIANFLARYIVSKLEAYENARWDA